jgi:general secretion pathway protein L
MLTEFVAWWSRQMLGLLPARLFADADRRGNILFADLLADTPAHEPPFVVLSRRRRRGGITLGRFALDQAGIAGLRGALRGGGRPDHIVLRARHLTPLEEDVTLPLAAESGIAQVLTHDMDRITPFRANDILWNWTVRRRDRDRARLHVRLTLIPRALLDPVIERLAEAGAAPDIVETVAADGSTSRLSVGQEARGARIGRRATRIAAGLCMTLAVVVAVLPFMRQAIALADTERAIAAMRPAVAQAEALRRRIAGKADDANAVVRERARTGDALAALAAITDILPDTTYLANFSLSQRQIAITGQSREAAQLITALSSDPAIRAPSFAAPVTRSGTNGADVFSIHAELAP